MVESGSVLYPNARSATTVHDVFFYVTGVVLFVAPFLPIPGFLIRFSFVTILFYLTVFCILHLQLKRPSLFPKTYLLTAPKEDDKKESDVSLSPILSKNEKGSGLVLATE